MSAVRTVVDVFEQAVAARPDKAMLRAKARGAWAATTFAQWHSMSGAWARGLVALGIEPGDRVAILSTTCRDWVVADMGILLAGAVTVPVYPTAPADEVLWVLSNSGARAVFVQDPTQIEKVLGVLDQLPALAAIVWFDDVAHLDQPDAKARRVVKLHDVLPAGHAQVSGIADLADRGRSVADGVLAERRAGIDPQQPCTIVYTSGTTGRPKGVALSHDAFVFEVEAATRSMDVRSDDSVMLFLPLAHSFAKIVYFVCVMVRTELVFPQGIPTLLQDMAEARPTVLPAVPRVFEKVHAKIRTSLEAAGPIKRRLFDAALATGREVSKLRQKGREPRGLLSLRWELANRVVFSKIHAVFGGRVRGFISGGAPLNRELAEFFHAIGLLILEGYGMTENCAAATVNRPDRFKFGSVGTPIDGVQVRVADDGEVLIKGRCLMTGYWQNEAATAEAIDGDGWLHTGDVGVIDAEGFLFITDRKKDLIVTAGGKNIAPQNIEAHLKTSAYLSQVLVYGDRRKFLTALVTLDEDAIVQWARAHGVAFGNYAELTQHADVWKLVDGVVTERNRTLASYETIKKFAILERDLTVEAGELTPSLKLRRREVTRLHQALLDSFYSEHY